MRLSQFCLGSLLACVSLVSAQGPATFVSPPTPCGQTFSVSPGTAVNYTVEASAPGNAVALFSNTLPMGASHTPPLPLTVLAPMPTVTSAFSWTPGIADVGTHLIVYSALNKLGNQTFCSVTIEVTMPVGSAAFDPITPCNQTLNASVGVPFSFPVSASAPGNGITLTSGVLPGTATHTPPLPLTILAPMPTATSDFNWTPGPGDIGTHTVTYAAFNKLGQAVLCDVTIVVAECFLLLGAESLSFPLGGPDTLLVDYRFLFPVTMESVPSIAIPNDPVLTGLEVYAQVGMLNPVVFPSDPLQLTPGLKIIIGSGTLNYGSGGSGMALWLIGTPDLGSTVSFGFSIPGM